MENLKNEILSYHVGKDHLVCMGKRTTLKTKLSSSEDFKQTELYKRIFNETDFLPSDADLFIRLKCILQGYTEIPKCPICHKERYLLKTLKMTVPLFSDTCGSNRCVAVYHNVNNNVSSSTKEKHRQSQLLMRKNALDIYKHVAESFKNNDYTLLDVDVLKIELEDCIKNRLSNSSIFKDSMLKDNLDVVCSVLKHTEFIPLKEINCKHDLQLQERIYCIVNGITSRVKCRFCDEPSVFISFKKGYSISCNKCITDKIRTSKDYPSQ